MVSAQVSVGPENPDAQIWAGPLSGPALAVILHNAGDTETIDVTLNLPALGISGGRVARVTDLLDGGGVLGEFTDIYSAPVAPQDVHFIRIEVVDPAPEQPRACGWFQAIRRWLGA